MKKILWVDLETTGLDYKKHGIISLAMLVEIEGKVVDEAYFEMCPTGKKAEKEALELNGYTFEQIRSFRPWEQVRLDVLAFLGKYVNNYDSSDKYILAGQNVSFDCDMMNAYFKFCGDDYWFSWVKSGFYLDTYRILPFLQYTGKVPVLENSKLGTMCDYFGVHLDNAHNAMDDIKATREVLLKMKELL